jgi:hypothetical protein
MFAGDSNNYKKNFMKTLRSGAIALLTMLSIHSIQAQTVDEIVSKYVDALGGASVLNTIKSLYVESTISVMGTDAPSTTYYLYGKGYKNELDFNGTKIVNCITDKGGWAINPMNGSPTPTAIPDEMVKSSQAQLQVGGPLFNYAAKGNKVEMIGKDTVGGPSYKLKLTTKDGVSITYYIDANTYYIRKASSKTTMNGADIETSAMFSNYKKTESGFVVANNQEIVTPQYTVEIANNKIEVNKTIDPTIFDMPK